MGYADRWEKKTPGDRIVADRAELGDRISADPLIIAETSAGDQLERGLQYLTGMDGITHSTCVKYSIFYLKNKLCHQLLLGVGTRLVAGPLSHDCPEQPPRWQTDGRGVGRRDCNSELKQMQCEKYCML